MEVKKASVVDVKSEPRIVRVTERDDRKHIRVPTGAVLVIELDAVDGGHEWVAVNGIEKSLLRPASGVQVETKSNDPKAIPRYPQTLRFHADAVGTARLVLKYRPRAVQAAPESKGLRDRVKQTAKKLSASAKQAPPVKTFTLTVEITAGP